MDGLDVSGVTDVTGFGLAGHLREMLLASNMGAELDLHRVPLLPGAAELLSDGVESTLAPSNRLAESEITTDDRARSWPQYAALFDPQTSGGLLIGATAEAAGELTRRLSTSDGTTCVVLGRITTARADAPRIRIQMPHDRES